MTRTPYRKPNAPVPKNCFYCNGSLSEEHITHSRKTDEFQVNWEGDIGCRKCFLPRRREEICGLKAALKKLKDRKGKFVPMFSVSINRTATIDWSGRSWEVEADQITSRFKARW
jgi:hypothetical protein